MGLILHVSFFRSHVFLMCYSYCLYSWLDASPSKLQILSVCLYFLKFFFTDLFIRFYVYKCFSLMFAFVRVLNHLELGLQTVINCHVAAGN